MTDDGTPPTLPPFGRDFLDPERRFTRIGGGELGGKAAGLVRIRQALLERFAAERFDWVDVDVPASVVIATDIFDRFLTHNALHEVALSDAPDDRIAHAFQRGELPIEIVGDLKALIDVVRTPLAVRSSSLLEDARDHPFAGVYATKMIPNFRPEPDVRFKQLTEAIKLVWASTFFRSAKAYAIAAGRSIADEKMAVLIQEVIGLRHGDRYYPQLSGVARSFNAYPSGGARPDEGVVHLALGLGKTIVDGGVSWSYAPSRPKAPPPFASPRDRLAFTQLTFWAIQMGRPAIVDPLTEVEYLISNDLAAAEYDGTLTWLASTYDASSDRLSPGVGATGPRVLDFAPLLLLQEVPFNDLARELLAGAEAVLGTAVEIEFAAVFPKRRDERVRLGFLQVRPLALATEEVEITDDELSSPDLVLLSHHSMGNGIESSVRDIVLVRPDAFEAQATRAIAAEVAELNQRLGAEGAPYVLIGFGRWGSSDPSLGIPVDWSQVCAARVLVECSLPQMNVEPSQGSHFFHNLTSFHASYFSVRHDDAPPVDWGWLSSLPEHERLAHVSHLRAPAPLRIKVDGRRGIGGIWRGAE